MNKLFILSIACFTLTGKFSTSCTTEKSYKLELTQIIFRHGDRVPSKAQVYKNDPYDLKYYKPKGYGQLTNKGKKRAYRIGEMLRERYDDFIGEYKPEDVYAFSTNYDRTKMSLQLLLAGLYPPSAKTSWSDSIAWTPIPTYYEPKNRNFLFANFSCPRFMDKWTRVINSFEIQQKLNKYDKYLRYFKNVTNIDVSRPFAAYELYSNLRSALSMELPLPDWCSREDYEVLKNISVIAYDSMLANTDMKRMMVGLKLEKILENMKNNESNRRKIYLYAAHDTTVGTFTRLHNFTGIPDLPDYGSTIIIETLSDQENNLYVQMALWTGVSEKLIPLKFQGSKDMYTLEAYEKMIQHFLPQDEDRYCSISEVCTTVL